MTINVVSGTCDFSLDQQWPFWYSRKDVRVANVRKPNSQFQVIPFSIHHRLSRNPDRVSVVGQFKSALSFCVGTFNPRGLYFTETAWERKVI